MLNLKPYFDAVETANQEVLTVAKAIDEAFGKGTEEGVQEAMGMRGALDVAQAKAKGMLNLYESMKAAADTGDSAAKFVPVSEERPENKKTISREEYEAMDYPARWAFFKAGGSIE